MRLIQYLKSDGSRAVGAIVDDAAPREVIGASSTRDLALEAHRAGRNLEQTVLFHGLGAIVDYDSLMEQERLLPPLDHPEPSRVTLSLTGLTHLGSAQSRNAMHAKLDADDLTDSMKMFKAGVAGGKPAAGAFGAQPEWGYKGDGSWVVAPGGALELPAFAQDGGEEGEIAGLYVIGNGGEVLRVGFAVANEFSDHIMERENYLLLAHSKLRTSSYGPELRLGPLPPTISGTITITRNGQDVWEGEMISGEDNMCHAVSNLEAHHFKYSRFRRPGDVHVHYFGASALSCNAGVKMQPGDMVEVAVEGFGRALRNTIRKTDGGAPTEIVQL
jgi:hypothetical protein